MMRSAWLVRTLAVAVCLMSSTQQLSAQTADEGPGKPVGEVPLSSIQRPEQKPYPEIVEVIGLDPSDRSRAPVAIGNEGTWVTTDDYPMSAQIEEAEGVTVTILSLNRAGAVVGCEIKSSSGNAALDAAACTALRLRARYAPAFDLDGNPIECSVTKRVRWILPDNTQLIQPPMSHAAVMDAELLVLRVHILPRRVVAFCEVITISRVRSALTERLCSHALDLILLRPGQVIPQEGLWFETILSRGVFGNDPNWIDQDRRATDPISATEAPPLLPPPPPVPTPLPEGVT